MRATQSGDSMSDHNDDVHSQPEGGFLRRAAWQFAEITYRYRTPHTKMTKVLRWSLMALRIYLVVLILLLVIKFASLIH